MARRTKEDAQATRQQLLQAAQRVFAEKGVSRTSLQDIAQAAGASRGAIYWHFKNKADLFSAMMDEAILPMEQAMRRIGHDSAQDPLLDLEQAMMQTIRDIATNENTRAIFEIATLKVEYVDELLAVQARHIQACDGGTREISRSLQEAATRRGVPLPVSSEVAALGLHALMVGLIHSWMLAPMTFDLVDVAQTAFRTHLAGLGLKSCETSSQVPIA